MLVERNICQNVNLTILECSQQAAEFRTFLGNSADTSFGSIPRLLLQAADRDLPSRFIRILYTFDRHVMLGLYHVNRNKQLIKVVFMYFEIPIDFYFRELEA